MALVLCPGCQRHVRASESACPFCKSAIVASEVPGDAEGPVGLVTRAHLTGLVVGAVAVSSVLFGSACAMYGAPTPAYGGPSLDGGSADSGGGNTDAR